MKYRIDRKVRSDLHGEYAFTVNLVPSQRSVGRCCLKWIAPGIFETHSRLREEYRGKGYGIALYARAIRLAREEGYRVCSAGIDVMSADARRLWSSARLRKEFRIYRRAGRFWVAAE
jgi:GNAT superfamily N-acetyltransferase